ncbi:MAG: non-homologous end-joining DNA ligase, partial [bacterium]|nr:non-homologous end-joining DNA ligase [bacterium]
SPDRGAGEGESGGGGSSSGTGRSGRGDDGSRGASSGRSRLARKAAPLTAHVDPAELPEPMLATAALAESAPSEMGEEAWTFEGKWDGVRAIVAVSEGRATLVSRSGRDMTGLYPELQEVAALVQADAAVLDGEVVAYREGRPDFGALQPRMKADPRDAAALAEETPVDLLLFDVLALTVDGTERGLLRTKYTDRRALLRQAVEDGERVRVPGDLGGDLAAALAASTEQRLEGVVAKRNGSVYVAGRRSRQWLKIKHRPTASVVVIGWRESGSREFASLLVALPDAAGELRYAGRVGSGFGDGQMEDLARRLAKLGRKTPPVEDVPGEDRRDARWVRASLVGEVEYAEITAGGRLRHAVWLGVRSDLAPGDLDPTR